MQTPTLTTNLLPHQAAAVEKVGRLRVGALFMEMGTGKSRTTIELVSRRATRVSRVLWFCPVALKPTVEHEIRKHVHGARVHVFDHRTREGRIPEADWYVIGIESMSSSRRVILAANRLADRNSMVVVDESSYIKGHRASRTEWITRIGERARYRLILTGTPLSQGVVDLYAQMRFLSPDILGYKSFYSFAHNHLEYSDKYRGLIVRAHNTGYLAARIAPYVYQVTKAECLTLPKKLYSSRYYWMTEAQRSLYEQAKNEILSELDEEELDSTVIYRLFTALQQITCGFWRRYPRPDRRREIKPDPETLEVPHGRLDLLAETLGELPAETQVIIWAKYRRCVQEIAARLEAEFGDRPARFYGDLNGREREAELERFRRGETRFFIATPSCGGHGLTLNEAHHVVFYTNGFKYAERLQAEDRCHRIGQTMPVTYIDLVCERSIDTRIQDALSRKANVVDAFRRQVEQVREKRTEKQALRELIGSL